MPNESKRPRNVAEARKMGLRRVRSMRSFLSKEMQLPADQVAFHLSAIDQVVPTCNCRDPANVDQPCGTVTVRGRDVHYFCGRNRQCNPSA